MNVHSSLICEDCQFHTFPYKANPPISGYGERLFESKEDVNDIIGLLIDEAKEWNSKGKNFDIALSVSKQLSFFCCPNSILSKDYQKSIQRYIYCNETSVPPYTGGYNAQPALWLDRYFIIKKALAKRDNNLAEKAKKENK